MDKQDSKTTMTPSNAEIALTFLQWLIGCLAVIAAIFGVAWLIFGR